MIKLLLSLLSSALLPMMFFASSQALAVDQDKPGVAVGEAAQPAKGGAQNDVVVKGPAAGPEPIQLEPTQLEPTQTEKSLWDQMGANPTLESLSVYLAKFPNGEFAGQAGLMLQALEDKARARKKRDKQLEAYRKQKKPGGIVLELDGKFTDIKPYFRSMVNSCGYTLVQPHRFAKRVYPTLAIGGQMFNGVSDSEHSVTLDLALLLKTTTREIQAREKMSSYRTSNVDTHRALIAAFEDIGAQMKSAGFCLVD